MTLVARTRRKKEKKIACPLLDVFACGQVSSLCLYRLNLLFKLYYRILEPFQCFLRFKYKDDLAVHKKRFHTVTVARDNFGNFIGKSAEKTAIVIQDPILIVNSDSDSEAHDV